MPKTVTPTHRLTRARHALLGAGAAVALTLPLASCGFDYATDRYYTPANGANNRDGVVDVLAAVVVSGEEGSGTFIASLSNNSTTEEQTFDELGTTESADIVADDFDPVDIPAGALVNLADPAAEVYVTGDFGAGDFVSVAVGFANGERSVLSVPVVPDTGYYEGLDTSSDAEPTQSPTSEESPAG